MRKSWWLALAVTGGLFGAGLGCDRAPVGKKAITLAPTGEPPTRNVATQPAAPDAGKPAAEKKSYICINGQWVEFPEAKLVLRKTDHMVLAFLASKDPPDVLSPKYRGNRYYFELKLDMIDDPANIAAAEFRYKAASAEPEDTPNGIFLEGDANHLQPYDIFVVFDREGDQITADIRGDFLYFAKGQRVGQLIPVAATLSSKIESR